MARFASSFQLPLILLASYCWIFCVGTAAVWGSDPKSDTDSEQRLVHRVNQRIRDRWEQEKVIPAAQADDAEFLRRVYLDLAGQIPPVSAVRRFLDDPAPQKRHAIVKELLESPRYIIHFSNVWRAELLPEVSADPQLQFLMPSFEA